MTAVGIATVGRHRGREQQCICSYLISGYLANIRARCRGFNRTKFLLPPMSTGEPSSSGNDHSPDAVDSAQVSKDPSEAIEQPEASTSEDDDSPQSSTTPWQAIWSSQHNAYYFFNSVTLETTWVNPLQASESTTSSSSASAPSHSASPQPEAGPSTSSYSALQAAAVAAGIDPSLAHLDPSLSSTVPGSHPGAFTYTAKFNARTGAFAKPDGRDPTHLSEYERAKRMSEFYFDVGAWEKDVEARKRAEQAEEEEGTGKKRKKPTKKDLVGLFYSLKTLSCLSLPIDTVQGAKEAEEDRKDGMASHVTAPSRPYLHVEAQRSCEPIISSFLRIALPVARWREPISCTTDSNGEFMRETIIPLYQLIQRRGDFPLFRRPPRGPSLSTPSF